jgi:hypothetical protein
VRTTVVATQRHRAFDAAIPRTHRERTRGLRGRDRLAPDEALLIERCWSVHTFGMRVPITVVFLDRSWRVIRVVRASSGRLLFCWHARHVLESHIAADVRIGDVLSLRAAPGGRATRGDRDSARPART